MNTVFTILLTPGAAIGGLLAALGTLWLKREVDLRTFTVVFAVGFWAGLITLIIYIL